MAHASRPFACSGRVFFYTSSKRRIKEIRFAVEALVPDPRTGEPRWGGAHMSKEGTLHAERVSTTVRQASEAPRGLGDERLLRSWQRPLECYHLDPSRRADPRILSGGTLKDHQESAESFRRLARHGVRKLHEQIRDAQYVVLLTDADGVTIDFVGNPVFDRELKRAGLYLGSCWSEREEGTWGVGTAIIDKAPIIVHKKEHFRAPNTSLSCSAAPIFDVDGELLAILDASALYSPDDKHSQALVFNFVNQSAGMVENAFFLDRHRSAWVLQLSPSREFLEVQTDYLIAFDEKGRILASNRKAQSELGAVNSIEDVFEVTVTELIRRGLTPNLIFPLRAVEDQRLYFARLRVPENESNTRFIAAPAVLQKKPAAPIEAIAGSDPVMLGHADRAKHLLNARISILLQGETGTGKEAFAKAIHASSRRAGKPFVALNCAAIPESLIESELFGYSDGAFTGARAKGMRGKILLSSGGTLFLDEIGDMPLDLQSRLLRVLAEGEIQPLGVDSPVSVDLHVICATHRNLAEWVAAGKFREDLYFRLNGASFDLPPLRLRTDTAQLVAAILREESNADGKDCVLGDGVLECLMAYRWPGNIRELRNALRYACSLNECRIIGPCDLPVQITTSRTLACNSAAGAAGTTLLEAEARQRQRILAALRQQHWHVVAAARDLNLSRATLYPRMQHLQIIAPNRLDGNKR